LERVLHPYALTISVILYLIGRAHGQSPPAWIHDPHYNSMVRSEGYSRGRPTIHDLMSDSAYRWKRGGTNLARSNSSNDADLKGLWRQR
jgi:hypothetical protein